MFFHVFHGVEDDYVEADSLDYAFTVIRQNFLNKDLWKIVKVKDYPKDRWLHKDYNNVN